MKSMDEGTSLGTGTVVSIEEIKNSELKLMVKEIGKRMN